MKQFTAWLWPDRTIGKRESRILRDEYNAVYNQRAELIQSLKVMLPLNEAYLADLEHPNWKGSRNTIADLKCEVEKARTILANTGGAL